MPSQKKKTSKKPSSTKPKFPAHFIHFAQQGKWNLSNWEKKVWQKIDQFSQSEIQEYLNGIFRPAQLQLSELKLANNPNYLYVFQGYQEAEQEDEGYYLLLEDYQTKNYQPLKYCAQKIAYEYLLGMVKSLLWSLRNLPFHRQEHFDQLFNY